MRLRRARGTYLPILWMRCQASSSHPAFEVPHYVGDLYAATRFERAQGGAEDVGPGWDASRHGTDVDKVEGGSSHEPGLRDIVDFELDVGRDPIRLYRRFAAIEG